MKCAGYAIQSCLPCLIAVKSVKTSKYDRPKRWKRNNFLDIRRDTIANGAVLWVDDAGPTLRDDDDVGFVRMVQDDGAGSVTAKKVAYPWLGLSRVETDNQSFTVLASAMDCERHSHWAIRW
jgi:hypothetical protein